MSHRPSPASGRSWLAHADSRTICETLHWPKFDSSGCKSLGRQGARGRSPAGGVGCRGFGGAQTWRGRVRWAAMAPRASKIERACGLIQLDIDGLDLIEQVQGPRGRHGIRLGPIADLISPGHTGFSQTQFQDAGQQTGQYAEKEPIRGSPIRPPASRRESTPVDCSPRVNNPLLRHMGR